MLKTLVLRLPEASNLVVDMRSVGGAAYLFASKTFRGRKIIFLAHGEPDVYVSESAQEEFTQDYSIIETLGSLDAPEGIYVFTHEHRGITDESGNNISLSKILFPPRLD